MIDMNAEIRYAKESPKLISFAEAFRDVTRSLSRAYSVPEDFYKQAASMERFEKGISINNAQEFFKHTHYDADKAAGIVEDFAKSRKLADAGINIGAEEFLRLGPEAKVNGRSLTIAALAQRAAKLESLLSPPNGIPDIYNTAQIQTRQALGLVERAAKLAYDWNTNWGTLTTEHVLAKASGSISRQKVAQAAMVGVLALAGCDGITVNFATPDITTQGATPTITEVVPAMTETQVLTPTVTTEPTLTETLIQTPTETLTQTPTETLTQVPTETPTITPTETLAPTPAGNEIIFDMSNPETITATDGNQYEGYFIDDHYGRRLVDSTNNIILVKDGDTWRVPESLNFTPEYPAVFYETKIGHSDGFDIPITMGLSENADEGRDFNFTEVHMTQLGADDAANVFLRSSWGRYKNIMGHPDVTFDQYLELVREGKGDIEVYDAIRQTTVLIDPRQGFSLVITGDSQGKMPLRCYDNPGFYFTSDEKGRFLYASNAAFDTYGLLIESPNFPPGVATNSFFLFGQIDYVVKLDDLPDSKMSNFGGTNGCPVSTNPKNLDEITAKIVTDVANFYNNRSDDPLFTLR